MPKTQYHFLRCENWFFILFEKTKINKRILLVPELFLIVNIQYTVRSELSIWLLDTLSVRIISMYSLDEKEIVYCIYLLSGYRKRKY